MIFVAVGTQKFQFNRLLKTIDDLVEKGQLKGEVFAQVGHSDYVPRNYGFQDFLSKDDFQSCISRCDLLITHSGVATIISGLKLNKRVVVVPRLAKFGEHVDDHQLQIAKSFSEKNLVLMCGKNDNLAEIAERAETHTFAKYVSQRDLVSKTIREYLDTVQQQKETGETRKKILISPTLGLDLEGISSVIYNYTKAMDRSGLELSFLTYGDLKPAVRQRFEELGEILFTADRKQSTLAYVKDYVALLKAHRFDVVHIHGNSGTMLIEVLLAKLCGVKNVMVHGHSTRTNHPLINTILKHPMMWLSRECIACSEATGAWLYGKHPYTLLNNAIELEAFRFRQDLRQLYREEFGIRDAFLIGHIGHFTEPKNHFFLIDVFAEFHKLEPNSRLLLISDGPRFQQVTEKVAQLGLQDAVIFAGRRSDVAGIYSAMDLFILPSCWEGLPLVLVEAQMNGLPVLVSDAVTKAAKCTDRVFYKPLEDGAESWAEKLQVLQKENFDRSVDSRGTIAANGFDIMTEAEKLRKLYLKEF